MTHARNRTEDDRQRRAASRSLRPAAGLLLIVMLLATVLRLWGIGFGFPERVRPDEQYFVQAIQRFDRQGTLDPGWYFYPSLYMYVNLAAWRTWTLVELFRGHYEVPDLRRPTEGLERLRDRAPNAEFLLGRLVTALFGIAAVAIVYAIARRFYGRTAGLVAGFLLAVNSLHVLNSHFYKNDIATTFLTLAALGAMMQYVETKRRGWNLGAAVLTGLATATNYYAAFALVPLVLSQFMACWPDRRESADAAAEETGGLPEQLAAGGWTLIRSAGRALGRWETWAMPVLAGAVYVAASPYCFIHWAEFLNVFHRMFFTDRQSLHDAMVRQVGFEAFGFQGSPLTYSLLFCLRHSTGIVLALVSIAGLLYLVVRRRAVDWLLAVFFLVHFFMIATGKAVFMRYYLSLVPILVIAAGALIVRVAERLSPGGPRRQTLVVVALGLLCGFHGLWVSVRQDALLSRTDTRVEARRWMERNIPGGTRVGVPMDWWGDFYRYGKPSIPAGSRYQAVRPNQARPGGVEYVLLDESPLLLYSPPERRAWSDWLARNARQVAEFDPFSKPLDEIHAVYDQLDAFYVPVARFSGVRRPGPRIRIYRVKPGSG